MTRKRLAGSLGMPIFVLGVMSLASACSDTTVPGTTPVTPSVVVSPTPDATGVPPTDTVTMVLDVAMDSASCAARFTLHQGTDTTGGAVPGHVAFADGYRMMMFVPDAAMDPGTGYFAQMRDSVMVRQDMDGMMGGGGTMGGGQMMMFMEPPAGALRVGSGMGWRFTTGS